MVEWEGGQGVWDCWCNWDEESSAEVVWKRMDASWLDDLCFLKYEM